MAHLDEQSPEAIDVSPVDDDAGALDAFDRILTDDETEIAEGEVPTDDETEAEDEGEEPEDEAEDADEQEEPAPAIPAPVSFNAEEKAAFAALPTELQQSIAATEARRNSQVQQATTAAAEAKRNAQVEAQAQLAQIQRQYAAGLEQYAKAFEVSEPDYSLIATNPQAFAEQMAYFKQATAQRQQMEQQSLEAKRQAEQAEQHLSAQHQAEQEAILAREIPEWNDATKRSELLDTIVQTGLALGFTADDLAQAEAKDVIALRTIVQDRAKAEKYDNLMAGKMEAVRAAKGKPAPITLKPGAAQPRGSGQRRALSDATTRLKQTGSDHDAMAAFEAMGL